MSTRVLPLQNGGDTGGVGFNHVDENSFFIGTPTLMGQHMEFPDDIHPSQIFSQNNQMAQNTTNRTHQIWRPSSRRLQRRPRTWVNLDDIEPIAIETLEELNAMDASTYCGSSSSSSPDEIVSLPPSEIINMDDLESLQGSSDANSRVMINGVTFEDEQDEIFTEPAYMLEPLEDEQCSTEDDGMDSISEDCNFSALRLRNIIQRNSSAVRRHQDEVLDRALAILSEVD